MTPEMRELFLKELELNGVNLVSPSWMHSTNVVQEISEALAPVVHEGKVSSFGVIFAENINEYAQYDQIHLNVNQLEMARSLADGIEWFILYHQDQFKGLLRLKDSFQSDLNLIRIFPPSGGTILQRNTAGETRFFQGEALIIHENRRWTSKPSVKEAVWKVSKCAPGMDKRILSRILEFSFYVLSPASRLGAILVWFLKEPKLKKKNLEHFQISIMEETHSNMIKHMLSQVDGATYLAPDGKLMNTGAHLKVSELSRKLIPPVKGTRHTSSIRFSYDIEDALVVTISEDGPVTVFFQGASIADLQMHSVYQKARDLKEERGDDSIQLRAFEVNCSHCHKSSMVEEIKMDDRNQMKLILCPVCRQELYSTECFSLECRPFKKLI